MAAVRSASDRWPSGSWSAASSRWPAGRSLTGTYFAFHDDVLKRLIARQAEMQFAYEDRIAELRAQVDRITSRQLLDQEQFEQKLEALVRKQSVLEQRAATLGSMPDMTTTGSIPKRGRAATPRKARSRSLRRSTTPSFSRRRRTARRGLNRAPLPSSTCATPQRRAAASRARWRACRNRSTASKRQQSHLAQRA